MALTKQALNARLVIKESLNNPHCFLREPNRSAARRSLQVMASAFSNCNNEPGSRFGYALRGFQAFWSSSVFYIYRQPKSVYSRLPKFKFQRYGFTMAPKNTSYLSITWPIFTKMKACAKHSLDIYARKWS